MPSKKIEVQGFKIRIDSVHEEDYVSLTDIAQQSDKEQSKFLIRSWLRNLGTLDFLLEWEKLYNPDFKVDQIVSFRNKYTQNRNVLTTKKYIEEMNAVGITSKPGRYGGTYAHKDIALEFCTWISPAFKVHLIKAFQVLVEQEFQRKNLTWHISKITNNIDEVRNLLDTIPHQNPENNRLKKTDN